MPPLLNIAVRAARRAADLIVRSLNRLDSLEVSSKGRNDFVSEVDKMAEADIIATIRRAYPDHAFLGEESGAIPGTGGGDGGAGDTVEWIIDPLDGTTNFLHGFPHFSVSIGCRVRGRMEHGVIYDPMRQELFTASRGGGAHLENRRLRVGSLRGLEGALLGTGFPYRANVQYLDCYMAMLKDFMKVAAGRTDGFFEIGLGPWDTAAGSLMVEEAGGRVGTLSGGAYTQGGNIIAASPKVYDAMVAVIKPHLVPSLIEG
jgi:myo-inositol-1(or 4)-monophosphatase